MGTRPEAIKLAPVILALRRHRARFATTLIVTAQHRQLLDQVLRLFRIRPDVDLDLMRPRQSPGDVMARTLTALEALWRRSAPDLLIVQGDTTSAFAGALAAAYRQIPVAHIEAGLRTGDRRAPFPEEINRRLIDALAEYLFAPTAGARRHLLDEGLPADRIFVTGNTGIDAFRWMQRRLRVSGVASRLPAILHAHPRLILVTAHRRESFGDGLRRICQAVRAIARAHPEAAIVYPVHPNPQVRQAARRWLRGLPNVHLTPPMDYATFVCAMTRAALILTDSGGVQEEAPSLGVPVLVMREATERTEALTLGAAQLVGTETAPIVSRTLAALRQPAPRRRSANPFGDGRASERIVRILERLLA